MTAASDLAPSYDLVVVGGGPAGLAAAALAARAGLSTVLFDENPGVGGQIYRGIEQTSTRTRAILGPDYTKGRELADAFLRSGVPSYVFSAPAETSVTGRGRIVTVALPAYVS